MRVALEERSQHIKAYERLQNNISLFVDRTNHELAALALLIKQKEQNIESLQRMANGQVLNPGERPAISNETAPPPPPPSQQPAPVQPPLPPAPPDHADVRARLAQTRTPHSNGQHPGAPAVPAPPAPPVQDAGPK